MIVDSSAIVDIVTQEPDEPQMLAAILAAKTCRMSAASWLETAIVVDGRKNTTAASRFETLPTLLRVESAPVTAEQAVIARADFQRSGRGKHPARLNYGVCFSYGLAKSTGEPLLFKGDDFRQTDVEPALRD